MRFEKLPILEQLMPFVHPEDANADYMLSGQCYEWYAGYAAALKPKSILEIGTRRGYSLLAMLFGAGMTGPDESGHYERGSVEEVAVIDNESYGVKLNWIEDILGTLRNGLGFRSYHTNTQEDGFELPLRYHGTDHASERWDIIHVDGDHTEAGALHDLELAAEALAPGGTIILDDVVFYADVAKALKRFEADHPGEWIVDHYPSLRGHALLTRRIETTPTPTLTRSASEGVRSLGIDPNAVGELRSTTATHTVDSLVYGAIGQRLGRKLDESLSGETQLDKVTASMFRPGSFTQAQDAVVGHCNGHSTAERWEIETPRFAERIVEVIRSNWPEPFEHHILDFGCGCGRLSKAIKERIDWRVIGFDTSATQCKHAAEYVGKNFSFYSDLNVFPLGTAFCQVAVSVYVLQHIPAIELRDSIRAIHSALKPDGLFIYCGSDYRLAVTERGFFDDRFCGVNVREEIARLFDEVGDLFPDIQSEHPLIRDMITAANCPPGSIAHPAKIYRKR